jgi:ABC-type multidrug transport system ATPase subunit
MFLTLTSPMNFILGAGKTTAFKIISCAYDANSGVGLVAGYDVSCERLSIFERLGYCPQFDDVWKNMTVKEHLLFFAKLKGIPKDEVQTSCLAIAAAAGLGSDTVYNRKASNLSGDMRRRLSIAIASVGAPKVLVLDEPTTGEFADYVTFPSRCITFPTDLIPSSYRS